MKFRQRRPSSLGLIRLPLIALIDVVFFMLFYFIIAGTSGGDEARLASTLSAERRGGGHGSDLSSQVLRVRVTDAKIEYVLGGRVVHDRAALAAIVRELPKEPGIIVKVADEATISAAATALQVVRDAGFTRVSYVASK